MHHLVAMTFRGVATPLLTVIASLPADTVAGQVAVTQQGGDSGQGSKPGTADGARAGSPELLPEGSTLMVPAYIPLFATPEDAQAFWDMAVNAYLSPAPDAREVARAFIKEQLGIDGDAYVVAHFATPKMRTEGMTDGTIVLTDALMRAFPEHSRYSFFGALADAVETVESGGRNSPSVLQLAKSLVACGSVEECFLGVGRFLWSRTGPGYIYNTFIGRGNVREVVHEDLRSLDDAFRIYPIASTFLPGQASSLRFSEVIDKFKEEGIFSELPYIKRLNHAFSEHWNRIRSDWPLLARYWFVHQARWARGRGVLTQRQYELIMKGGAPNVPLTGAITLRQLRNAPPDASVKVRRFDINGYAASDIVRFVDSDGSEVMYMPGADSPFIVFPSESELRQWVVRQTWHPGSLDELLSHFSIYNRQDGVFWTGVAQGLAKLGSAEWKADATTVDRGNTDIAGDVFEDMRAQVETRRRDDVRLQTTTAWDAWRATFNRMVTALGPLGYAPPLAIPVQAGSALFEFGAGLDQGIHGKTVEERKIALEQAVMTVVTGAGVSAATGSHGAPLEQAGAQASAASLPRVPSLQRVNGRIGYLMGGVTGPRLPEEHAEGEQGTPAVESAEESPRRHVFDPLSEHDDRQPPSVQSLRERGYLVMTVPSDVTARTRQVIDLKKIAIDEKRHRLDDFRMDSLATNATGSQLSFDQSLVYRVDDRTPRQLLASGGFGPSREFNAISPMLRQPSTIGSGSLVASNLVLQHWQKTFRNRETYHQYAIWTEGRTVAAGRENRHLENYDTPLDEVHFPADIPTKDIYIIDSFDPQFAHALARIYESRYVSTPYGVPLEAFTEYLDGRLDIDLPNQFTATSTHLDLSARIPSPDGCGSASTIDMSYQPLSSSESAGTSSSPDETTPLLRPPNRLSAGQQEN